MFFSLSITDDFCNRKFFDKLYTTKKIYQTVEEKQLLIVVPFLGHLSFETTNRSNSCIRNQLPFCSFRTAFQSKSCLSILFKVKDSIPKYLHSYLIYKFLCSCNRTDETERHLLVQPPEHLGITQLTKKQVKNLKRLPLWTIFY